MNQKRKEKIRSILFLRACCCLGIVIFHYSYDSKGKFKFLLTTANSDFGFMFVTTFFCISGFVLYYNYPSIISIKKFYYKRWKSILVPYYICFIYFFFRESFRYHRIIFYKHWEKFLLNIFGLDGYFGYRIKSYSLTGEWFLGAIVIIYILFPIILFIIKKTNIIINNIFFIILYFFMYKTNYFIIIPSRNIITCILSFYFGMESLRFKKYILDNNKILGISALILLLLCTIKININFPVIIFQIQGFSLFIFLYKIGHYIMETKINAIIEEISNLSYSIFLLQHRFISDILSIHNPEKWYFHLLLLELTITIIIICSKIHLIVVNSVLKSYIFQKLDALFI